jgi:crotonobetainyl-CoA hydratase
LRGPRQLPLKVVMDLALTGDPITAEQALAWGLVSRLADDPVGTAVGLARRIASFPSAAVLTTKASIHRGLDAFLTGEDSAWDRVEPDVMAVLTGR